jgi:hypothetical protein
MNRQTIAVIRWIIREYKSGARSAPAALTSIEEVLNDSQLTPQQRVEKMLKKGQPA